MPKRDTDGRWKPGASGNPKGRPHSEKSLGRALERALLGALEDTGEEAIRARLSEMLSNPNLKPVDVSLLKLVVDRVEAMRKVGGDALSPTEQLIQHIDDRRSDLDVLAALLAGHADDEEYLERIVETVLSSEAAEAMARRLLCPEPDEVDEAPPDEDAIPAAPPDEPAKPAESSIDPRRIDEDGNLYPCGGGKYGVKITTDVELAAEAEERERAGDAAFRERVREQWRKSQGAQVF